MPILSYVELNPTTGQSVFSNVNLEFVTTTDIFVTIIKANGDVTTLTTSQFTVASSPSLTVTITDSAVSDALTTADTVRIFRDTSVADPARIFSNGSVLKASDLNAGFDQIRFAQQEIDDTAAGDALQKDTSGVFWDASELFIRNLKDGIANDDAVTLGQVNAALATSGNNPSVPQSYSTASGTLTNGTFNSGTGHTTFSMTPTPTSEFEQTFIVEIDGVIQRPNDDYTVVAGATEGTLTILNGDVSSSDIVVNNFGLSRQVFDFPTTGQASTSTETPITLQGHSSQSVCIFLVEQSGGDDIFCVNNDHVKVDGRGSTSPLIVKQNVDGNTNIVEYRNAADQVVHRFRDPTESTGDAGAFYEIIDNNTVNAGADVLFKLNRSAVNDANNEERGNIIEVEGNTGSGSQTVFEMNQNGRVRINATDDTVATAADADPALTVEFSGSSDQDPAAYIKCIANDGKTRHVFGTTESRIGGGGDEVAHVVKIGSPDPTGDNTFPLRCGITPSNDGISGTHSDKPYWRFTLTGTKAATNRRALAELTAMSSTATADAFRLYRAGDAITITMTYDGRIKLDKPSRTKNAEDVLRKDEVAKAAGITLCTHNTNDTATTLVDADFGFASADGRLSGSSKTTADTSTYTIASNNAQIAVSQASGVVTVAAGTFLATYSVDAQYGENGSTDVDFELQLLKNGSVVATSQAVTEVLSGDETRYISLNYSELITTTGDTTYQLQGKATLRQDIPAGSIDATIKTRQKTLLIQNLGES